MEVRVLENTKKKLIFEVVGLDHTFCNVLKTELNKDDAVKVATYTIAHPLVRVPKFIVETKGDKDPVSAVKAALKKVGKINEEFLANFKKAK